MQRLATSRRYAHAMTAMFRRLTCILALGVAGAAGAQPRFPAGYDGYAEMRGPAAGMPSFHLLLSRAKCPTPGAPAGWKKGAYLYRQGGPEAACWTTQGQDVRLCPRGQYETEFKDSGYGSTTVSPCHVWPLDRFYEIER
jgi:hypothetical protein